MSPLRLRSRLPAARERGAARLMGHRLAFHKSGTDGSGKCDIPRCDRSIVFGALYEVRSRDFAILDQIEGVGEGYEREAIDVWIADQTLTAHTYIATRIDPSLRPFGWYLHHVLAGALAAGAPAQYVEWIRSIQTIQDHDLDRERSEISIYHEREAGPGS